MIIKEIGKPIIVRSVRFDPETWNRLRFHCFVQKITIQNYLHTIIQENTKQYELKEVKT